MTFRRLVFVFSCQSPRRGLQKYWLKKSFPGWFKHVSQSLQEEQTSGNSRGKVSFACRGHWSPGPSVSWYATSLLSPGLCDISSSFLHQSYILLISRNAGSWFNSLKRGGRGCGGRREGHMGRKEKGDQSIHPSASTIQSDHTYLPTSSTLVTHVRDWGNEFTELWALFVWHYLLCYIEKHACACTH